MSIKGNKHLIFSLFAFLSFSFQAFSLNKIDFNNDGHIDLFSVDVVNKDLLYDLSNGDGTFAVTQSVNLPVTATPDIVLPIDLNLDGFDDLIVLGTDDSLVTLLNDTLGGFGSEDILSLGLDLLEDVTDLVVIDTNDDGLVDVAVGVNGLLNGRVLIFPYNSVNQELDPYFSIELGLLSSPEGVHFADINVDGHLDMLVEDALGSLYRVLSDGLGGFLSPSPSLNSLPTGKLFIADTDGDGIPDVINLDEVLGLLTVRLGLGDATFDTGISFNTGLLPSDAIIYDINLDGLSDILVVNADGDSIDLYLGDAVDTLLRAPINIIEDLLGTLPIFSAPVRIITGDFNSDCVHDYAIWNDLTNDYLLMFNQLGPDSNDLIFCSVFEIL
jgi:hypothetical protein